MTPTRDDDDFLEFMFFEEAFNKNGGSDGRWTCDETAENEFQSSIQAFLDSLDDEDYILVIDGHSFP